MNVNWTSNARGILASVSFQWILGKSLVVKDVRLFFVCSESPSTLSISLRCSQGIVATQTGVLMANQITIAIKFEVFAFICPFVRTSVSFADVDDVPSYYVCNWISPI